MLLLGKILYIEKKIFNIACQYLDIMDEYLLFEFLLFNIHFSPCILKVLMKTINSHHRSLPIHVFSTILHFVTYFTYFDNLSPFFN